MQNLNRSSRRKLATKVATDVIKGRAADTAKKQYGLGVMLTNLMLVVMIGPWAITLYDRRRPDSPSVWRSVSYAIHWRWVRFKMGFSSRVQSLLIRWRGHRA